MKKLHFPTIAIGILVVLLGGTIFSACSMLNQGEDTVGAPISGISAGAGVPTVTANTDINVRAGPGTNYPIYGVAPSGSKAEVVGRNADGQWWAIKVPTSVTPTGLAWVSAQYVTASNVQDVPVIPAPPLPPSVALPTPQPNTPTVTAIAPLPVRGGPGAAYEVYVVAPVGASAQAVGVSSDGQWYIIAIPTSLASSGQGWVLATYVRTSNTSGLPVIQEPPPQPKVVPPTPPADVPYFIATEPINVRAGPGSSYTSYGTIPIGASGVVTGKSSDGTWWVIRIPPSIASDQQGWVSAAYVQTYNTESVPVVPNP